MMRFKYFIVSIVVALSLGACTKEVSYETNYVLRAVAQGVSGDQYTPMQGVVAYAFDADTMHYGVATYDDALSGVITHKEDASQRITTPTAQSSPYMTEEQAGWYNMTLSSPSQMVVVVDTVNKLYAYTQEEIEFNLTSLYVTLSFVLWREGSSYKEGAWSFYNDFFSPPTITDTYINPVQQIVDGGELSEISSLKAYAFAADTMQWRVASYDDAFGGKITSKTDSSLTRNNPNFTAYKESDSHLYKMQVSSPDIMVVVVDRINRLFAYTQKRIDLDADPVTLDLTFRVWREEYIYDVDGWVFVDENSIPDTEPTNK